MVSLTRDVEKWLMSLDLQKPIRRPKRDLANGFVIAEILSVYHPRKVKVDTFFDGLSMDTFVTNWFEVGKLLKKLGIVVPQRIIDATRHYKDGGAELFLEELYRHFTDKQINRPTPRHRVDFSDHAYQMSSPYVARATASKAVKHNIRFSELAECTQPSRIAWRASRILARHMRDRAAERLASPQRFDRCPSLAERAPRRSPPPVCSMPGDGWILDTEDDDDNKDAGEDDTDTRDQVAEKCTADSPYDIEPPTVITNLCEQDVQQSAPRPAAAAQCLQSAVHGMWRPRMCY